MYLYPKTNLPKYEKHTTTLQSLRLKVKNRKFSWCHNLETNILFNLQVPLHDFSYVQGIAKLFLKSGPTKVIALLI
jgi:hypothetical protein